MLAEIVNDPCSDLQHGPELLPAGGGEQHVAAPQVGPHQDRVHGASATHTFISCAFLLCILRDSEGGAPMEPLKNGDSPPSRPLLASRAQVTADSLQPVEGSSSLVIALFNYLKIIRSFIVCIEINMSWQKV